MVFANRRTPRFAQQPPKRGVEGSPAFLGETGTAELEPMCNVVTEPRGSSLHYLGRFTYRV